MALQYRVLTDWIWLWVVVFKILKASNQSNFSFLFLAPKHPPATLDVILLAVCYNCDTLPIYSHSHVQRLSHVQCKLKTTGVVTEKLAKAHAAETSTPSDEEIDFVAVNTFLIDS